MKDNDGEHPYGDSGQLILLAVFLAVWVLDSFVFKWSMMLAAYVPWAVRIPLAMVVFTLAVLIVNASHKVVHEGRDKLITTGAFRHVRHPLYLGNFLMWLGIAMLTANFWLIMAFIFMYWVYYERIMYAEEQFLEQKFGEFYIDWAGRTPAFIPDFRKYQKPNILFSWKKVLKNEKNGFNAIFLLFYIFQMAGEFITTGSVFTKLNFWFWAMIFSTITYFILKFLKKGTNFLEEPGR